MAEATKRSSVTTGSILVVKSTRLSVTTLAELGTLIVFSPTQKTEANEYASIITRTDASGLPAPPVDAARLAALEGLSGSTLPDLDRSDVMKFVKADKLGDFAKVGVVPPPPDPLIGTKLSNIPHFNGSAIEMIASATITSTDILYITASDDTNAARTSRISRVNAQQYISRSAPPGPHPSYDAQGISFVSILKAMPLSSALADPNLIDFVELVQVLSGTQGGAQLQTFIRTSNSLPATTQAVKQALEVLALELQGMAMGAFTMPTDPTALGVAFEAMARPRRGTPRSSLNPAGFLPRANTNAPLPTIVDANRYPLVATLERLALDSSVFASTLNDVVEIFEPPPRVVLVRKFLSSQIGSLEQALRRLKITPAFLSTLGPVQSLSAERLWELLLEWSTRQDSDTAASSASEFSGATLASVIASVQAATLGVGDSRAYAIKGDLDPGEVTALRSSVLAAFANTELAAKIKSYHDLARAQNLEGLQNLYAQEVDPDIRMILDTPSEQFATLVTSSCSTVNLNMLETIRCARSSRIETHLYGKKTVPPLVASALKRLSALRLSTLSPTELIDVKNSAASGLLANLSKLSGDASLSTFQQSMTRLNQVLCQVLPAQASEIQSFTIAVVDKVREMRLVSTSWDTISTWYKDLMKAVEAPLELSVGRRLGGFAKLDLRVALLTEDSHYAQTLQMSSIDDRFAALAAQVPKVKQGQQQRQPGAGATKAEKAAAAAAAAKKDTAPKLGQFPADVYQAKVTEMKVAHPTGCPNWHVLGKACWKHEAGKCKLTHDGASGKFAPDESTRLPFDPNLKPSWKGKRKAGN